MFGRIYILAAFLMPLFVTASVAQVMTEAPGWRQQAVDHLTKGGSAIIESDLTGSGLRCVRMNNYGCIMQPSGDTWNGSIGRDSVGHAVFSSPEWSIRAVVRDYCSKHARGVRSALALSEAYSPWCDTLGTVGVRGNWGRSCRTGPQPPPDFGGPLCSRPADGEPAPGQCASCNCPSRVAERLVAGLGMSVTEPLGLFAEDGTPDADRLKSVLRNKMRVELGGFMPTDAVLDQGIDLHGPCA
ncbi:hypothetical protein [Salinarimonas chemoclinalis]|uniref:hypothetical protein n=1 Tax=Salinarimonas chemoclinalis TaxID=3241599 RepID=UPI00355788D9